MKNFIIIMLALVMFAVTAEAVDQEAAKAALAKETITGRAESVCPIYPDQGTDEGSISLVDDAGKVSCYTINTDTKISDSSGSQIESDDIADGDTVTVTYSKSDEGNIAESVAKISIGSE